MKSFYRIIRRRDEAARRLTRSGAQTSDVFPIMNRLRRDLPCEVIDLSVDPLGEALGQPVFRGPSGPIARKDD